jgi:hypothetical protein
LFGERPVDQFERYFDDGEVAALLEEDDGLVDVDAGVRLDDISFGGAEDEFEMDGEDGWDDADAELFF